MTNKTNEQYRINLFKDRQTKSNIITDPEEIRKLDEQLKKEYYEKLKSGAETKKKEKKIVQPDSSGSTQPFISNNQNIIKSDYVQIPQLNKIISKFELPNYNNLNWQNTHFKLHENGLLMPTIPEFMTYFNDVVASYKSKGKNPLFDATGNPLNEKEIEDIYFHLTKNHIAVYGKQKGAWAWLDAKFNEDNEMKISSEHRTITDANGNKSLKPNKIETLESCLNEDCYVDFKLLNSQGLPNTKSSKQKYVLGENIYYWYPRDKQVAGFYAYSSGAYLDCDWDPADGGSDLGVFGVGDAG